MRPPLRVALAEPVESLPRDGRWANAIGFGDITYRTVPPDLTVEVRQQATRHRTATVTRFRGAGE